jgi:hypothetical protein
MPCPKRDLDRNPVVSDSTCVLSRVRPFGNCTATNPLLPVHSVRAERHFCFCILEINVPLHRTNIKADHWTGHHWQSVRSTIVHAVRQWDRNGAVRSHLKDHSVNNAGLQSPNWCDRTPSALKRPHIDVMRR